MVFGLRERARSHLQLVLLVIAFLASLELSDHIGPTGVLILPPVVEQYIPPVTIVLGIIIVAWTLYLFVPHKEPLAPKPGA
ncbi:MAG: hypothetical protein AABX52_02040 [Nanoarchaeota archaeon]